MAQVHEHEHGCVGANRRVTLNKGMANRFKGEGTGNINRIQEKNLLSEGVHLGRKSMLK